MFHELRQVLRDWDLQFKGTVTDDAKPFPIMVAVFVLVKGNNVTSVKKR
jgi:hypothetical protein